MKMRKVEMKGLKTIWKFDITGRIKNEDFVKQECGGKNTSQGIQETTSAD